MHRICRLGLCVWLLAYVLSACTPSEAGVGGPAGAPNLLSPAAEAGVNSVFPTFSWSPVDGASYYLIVITQDGTGSALQIISDTSRATTYTPTRGLSLGSGYTWRVTAGSDAGVGSASDSRHFVVSSNSRPGPPILTNLDGVALANGEVAPDLWARLHWRPRAPLLDGEMYELDLAYADGGSLARWVLGRYSVSARGEYLVILSDDGETREPRLGIDCGSTYRWRVRVLRYPEVRATAVTDNDAGWATAFAFTRRQAAGAGSAWSETWTFSVPPYFDGVPLLMTPADGAHIADGVLEWAPLGGRLRYEYEILDAPNAAVGQGGSTRGTVSEPLLIGVTSPEFSFELHPGRTYYWHVRATRIDGLCAGAWSDLRSFVWDGPDMNGPLGQLDAVPRPCAQPPCPTETLGPPPPTVTRTPRPTRTPPVVPLVVLPSATPTLTSPAPTSTPTMPVPPSATPVPSATLVPPSATATASPPPADTSPPVIAKVGTSAVPAYYLTGCGPNNLTVSAQVTDPAGVSTVTLQYRYRAASGSVTGKWRVLPMAPVGGDMFSATIDLTSSAEAYADLAGVDGFIDYVLVARDGLGNEGGTPEAAVTLLYCPS